MSQDAAKQVWFCSLDTPVQCNKEKGFSTKDSLNTKPKRVVNLEVGKTACAVQMVNTRRREVEVMACLYYQTPRQSPIKMACIELCGNVHTVQTETDANFHWVLATFCRSRYRAV